MQGASVTSMHFECSHARCEQWCMHMHVSAKLNSSCTIHYTVNIAILGYAIHFHMSILHIQYITEYHNTLQCSTIGLSAQSKTILKPVHPY